MADRERNESLWDIGDVAKYLRLSERTVMRRIEDSGLPYIRIGGTLRFRREDIDSWLTEGAAA